MLMIEIEVNRHHAVLQCFTRKGLTINKIYTHYSRRNFRKLSAALHDSHKLLSEQLHMVYTWSGEQSKKKQAKRVFTNTMSYVTSWLFWKMLVYVNMHTICDSGSKTEQYILMSDELITFTHIIKFAQNKCCILRKLPYNLINIVPCPFQSRHSVYLHSFGTRT